MMSNLSPPPPPPNLTIQKITMTNCHSYEHLSPKLCQPFLLFDDQYSEIHHAIKRKILNRPGYGSHPYMISFYKQVPSMLQDGPMCGLVALNLAAIILNKECTVSDLLEISQKNNWSIQGEMFNAENLCKLAENVLNCNAELMSEGLQDLEYKVLSHLSSGSPVLVPYDSDRNHEPCLNRGHKAHWAVLSGILYVFNDDSYFNDYADLTCHDLTADKQFPFLHHANVGNTSSVDLPHKKTSVDVFLYAKHGKSRYLDLWKYDLLAESNSNLVEISPDIIKQHGHFVLPSKDIKSELCSTAILLSS